MLSWEDIAFVLEELMSGRKGKTHYYIEQKKMTLKGKCFEDTEDGKNRSLTVYVDNGNPGVLEK